MESSSAGHGSLPAHVDTGSLAVVCLSPQRWDVDLPTNRQQIMTRVRQRGHHVVFVETGPWALRYLRVLLRGPERRSLLRQLRSGEPLPDGIRLLKAPTVAPWGHKYRTAARINARLTARAVRRHLRHVSEPIVLWLYDPCFADCIGLAGERFAVYDCVDDYPEQTGGDARKHALVARYDRLAAARARLVFATATSLLERHRAVNPRTTLVRNVGDFAHFSAAASRDNAAPEVAGLPRPVIGFAGNFDSNKVDFALLEHLASTRDDGTLLLIGPSRPDTRARIDDLARRANVRYLDARSYASLPSYVAAFDVAIIPYLANAYTRSCFPLKTFEYLAAGKPVVASGLPELSELAPHVDLAAGPEAFVLAVERALLRTGDAHVAARRRLAASNTWETRTSRLLDLISGEMATASLPARARATMVSR